MIVPKMVFLPNNFLMLLVFQDSFRWKAILVQCLRQEILQEGRTQETWSGMIFYFCILLKFSILK